jgi:hypothetical protein
MLVPLRPSNEDILSVCVPGAQDQRGCPSNLFPWGLCEQESSKGIGNLCYTAGRAGGAGAATVSEIPMS